MANKYFYITTTAPYVNADPHIGFALEILQADVISRYKRLVGYEVAFGFGTDEHGVKIYRKALENHKSPKTYCDEFAAKFDELKNALNLSTNFFIRTTDPNHVEAAQEFWRRCFAAGDIYKKNYKIKYCVGCEMEKTDSELDDGKCPIHPNLKVEIYEEENYFFRFSKYQQKLVEFYDKNTDFVIPKHRLTEIRSFVAQGLEDFSVSRLKKKMPWGVDVPGDENHVMYVWFDALVFYISTLGWPKNLKQFEKYWPGMQVAGKDNLRQQSAIWQAMLMSAGIPNSRQIVIHGFITSNGQKMSKSLGNVVNPFDLISKYGVDPVRYYLLKEIPAFEDGDFSYRRMNEIYSSDLANELGNLVSRLTNLGEKDNLIIPLHESNKNYAPATSQLFDNFQFNAILDNIWKDVKNLNKKIDDFAPWKKSSTERHDFLLQCFNALKNIGWQLLPFLPDTAEKIQKASTGTIKKIAPMFPRLP